MIEASEVELTVYRPKVESLRNTIDYLASVKANIESELPQAEVDDRKHFLEYVSAVQAVISIKHDDQEFKEKAIRAIDLKIIVSLDQQSVSVECVLGSEILPLYENTQNSELMSAPMETEVTDDVRITNVSRTRCMDQMP